MIINFIKVIQRKARGFTLVELLVVITIIGILSSIGLGTFTSSQMKSRDARRKTQLKQLTDAFEAYYNDNGEYPASDGDGNLDGLTWGSSSFEDDGGAVYMVKLPQDPTVGLTYRYEPITENNRLTKFQLYSRLENTNDGGVAKDADLNPQVFDGLDCGTKECNYGVSSSNTHPQTGRSLVSE